MVRESTFKRGVKKEKIQYSIVTHTSKTRNVVIRKKWRDDFYTHISSRNRTFLESAFLDFCRSLDPGIFERFEGFKFRVLLSVD
jgi:hypothetical protein